MVQKAPDIIPMITYEDGVAAIEWLSRAFGFRERARRLGPDGRLAHGEMEIGRGLIMLATATPDYESPKHHREACDRARRWSDVPWVIGDRWPLRFDFEEVLLHYHPEIPVDRIPGADRRFICLIVKY
jgi:hypothetical protein